MGRTTQPLTSKELIRVDRATGALVVRKYRLAVVAGPSQGKEAPLLKPTTLGSGNDAAFKLEDPTVSRNHVQLSPRADGVWVKDLGSMNGTKVSGARIDEALIESEATLAVGNSLVRISIVEDAVDAPLGPPRLGDAVAASPAMRRVLGVLERVARSEAPIVLLGETGTGKDVLARAAHASSARAHMPLTVFDCSAVTPTLIESELFGHEKGAFTGAAGERRGVFQQAHGGTLFIDEIGELPLDLQPRLLRAVESGQVKALGKERAAQVDVRIIAATHRDLEAAVKAGKFRQDLFYRLAVAMVKVPPLRERPEDIPLLAERFVRELQKEDFSIPPALMERMVAYDWPGNVRELRNVVARAILGEANALAGQGKPQTPQSAEPFHGLPFKEAKERLVDNFTRDYVETLLQRHGGNVSRAARAAGLARPYLHKLAVKYGLKEEGTDDEG